MVYIEKTFEICHGLTETGKEEYARLLEREADRILFKSKHPFKYIILKLKETFAD